MTDKYPVIDAPSSKVCPWCNKAMAAITIDKSGDAAWECLNPGCSMNPTFFRPSKISVVPFEVSADKVVVDIKQDKHELRQWMCVRCDNPVEIIDRCYHVWNCPTCYLLLAGGPNFIYFDEAGNLLECSYHHCWDPYSDDDDDDGGW